MISLFPKSFLGLLPLQIGAEIICALGVFNLASGFYGFLSLFTGHPLSAMEWIMNLLALLMMPIYILGFRAVINRDALLTVVFAYVYTFSTLTNVLFVVNFSVSWFTTSAFRISESHAAGKSTGNNNNNAENVVATLTSSALLALSTGAENATNATQGSSKTSTLDKSASLSSETAVSMVIPVALIMIRAYFNLVVLSYARLLVRQYNLRPNNGEPKGSWNAKVQAILLSMFQSFWYGSWAPSATKMTSLDAGDRESDALTSSY